MSYSRPGGHQYTNSMNSMTSQGSFERHQPIDIPSSSLDFQRRIWVKVLTGNPTTLMVQPEDLIDDVKTMVIAKYPNTLGKQWDSADLVIQLNYKERKNLSVSPEKSGLYASSPSSSGLVYNPMNKLIPLEADQNIFHILDTYYSSGMSMYDAFIIKHPREEFQHPAKVYSPPVYHHPKPQYELLKERSLSPSLQSQLSPMLQTRLSPIPSGVLHRRSQSNPPQSPASQAVLLLPKNFSLTNDSKKQGTDGKYNNDNTNDNDNNDNNDNSNNNDDAENDTTNDDNKNNDNDDDNDTAGYRKLNRLNLQKVKNQSANNVNTLKSNQSGPDNENNEKSTKNEKSEKIDKSTKKSTMNSTTEKVLPSISVLVVEDNAINQAILGAFLRKHKIHYQIAKNGQEAIDKWRIGGFHLILMDIQLPIKSGIEATEEIRRLEQVNHIGVFNKSLEDSVDFEDVSQEEQLDMDSFRSPVIIVALTASSNSSVDRQNALMAGCNDYLTKPVNLVWLQNKITEWGCMQALIDFDGWKLKSSNLIKGNVKNNTSGGYKKLELKPTKTIWK